MSAPPPPYAMLDPYGGGGVRPPPYRRSVPQYNHKKCGSSCCYRWICGCYCFLFLLILILCTLMVYFFFVYVTKFPTYSVQDLRVKSFNVGADVSLTTDFVVTVRAENPNANIAFKYGKDSSIIVQYTDRELCRGKIPSFYQGHYNVTILQVDLQGRSEFGSGLLEVFQESQRSHRIPLLILVKVPVVVVVGDFPLRQFIVHVNCSLVVDNLAPNKKIGILERNVTYSFNL